MKKMNSSRRGAAVVLAVLALTSCGRYLEARIDSPEIRGDTVTFRFRSPSARTVQVAGDFNNWGAGDAETGEVLVGLMRRGEEGLWELSLPLPPGRYRYVFLVNEITTVLDPSNPRVVPDGRGGKADLLIVP